jgi:hypothetical protein
VPPIRGGVTYGGLDELKLKLEGRKATAPALVKQAEVAMDDVVEIDSEAIKRANLKKVMLDPKPKAPIMT